MSDINKSDPILVIIGPSAVGKSTLATQLIKQGLVTITPTWTTRPLRPGESPDDNEHIFCDQVTFEKKLTEGYFIGTVQPFKDGAVYGMPRMQQATAGTVPLVLLRSFVTPTLQKYYTNVVIYQVESPRDTVEQRLKARAQDSHLTAERLAMYDKEVAGGQQIADRVFVNQVLSELVSEISQAIQADFADSLAGRG